MPSPLENALAYARALPVEDDGPLYIVGGTVREALRGLPSADLDVACAGGARALAARAASALGGRLVVLDPVHKVYRVVLGAGAPYAQIDVSKLKAPRIEQDLARRDFTVNAMAVEVKPSGRARVIDPFGGRADLKRRVLRMTAPRAFRDDGLRLLRAFRIAAELDLRFDGSTDERLAKDRGRLKGVAGERVRYELMRLFETPKSGRLVRAMARTGVLGILFPETKRLKGCAHVYYGKGGVLEHSLRTLERLDQLLADLPGLWPSVAAEVSAHLEARRFPGASFRAVLRLTALLHDIAKPATARVVDGRLRFFGHEELGAELAAPELKRLRFSREEVHTVATIIRHHLRPGNLSANPTISDKAMFRFFSEIGAESVGLLLVCWADYSSYLSDTQLASVLRALRRDPRGPSSRLAAPLRKTHRHIQAATELLEAWFRRRSEVVEPPRLVDGKDVMSALSIHPGPKVGAVLKRVREAQASGRLKSRDEALAYLKGLKSR